MTAVIRLTHSHAEGTLAHGTTRGDGTAEVLKAHRWRWSRNLGCWYVPHSRDRLAKHPVINATRVALEAVGFTVEVEVDETSPRPPAEVEAGRADRVAARAERLAAQAGRQDEIAEAAYAASQAIADRIPLGQPILVDHHSAPRHRRDLDRMRHLDDKAHTARQAATQAEQRAAELAADPDTRHTPHAVQARLERIGTDLRGVVRRIEGSSHNFGGGYIETTPAATGEHLARLRIQRSDLEAQRDYWQDILDRLQANGAVVHSRDTVAAGDEVLIGGQWYEVLRANTKTVTVRSSLHAAWTDRAPYHQIRDHRPSSTQPQPPTQPTEQGRTPDA